MGALRQRSDRKWHGLTGCDGEIAAFAALQIVRGGQGRSSTDVLKTGYVLWAIVGGVGVVAALLITEIG